MTNNVNSNHYRSVKLKMSQEDIHNYIPKHKGLDFNFYAPIVEDGRNLLHEPGYDKKQINWVDLIITASNLNPDPLHARDMRDIDEELAHMDSKYRVLKDRLTHTDNKNLINLKQPEETFTKHGTVLSHPFLQDNDHLISKMTEIHDTDIPLEEVREWEAKFEKRKSFYSKSKLKDYSIIESKEGKKFARFKMGYI